MKAPKKEKKILIQKFKSKDSCRRQKAVRYSP
jgi:hypothetical protein